jgi:hypothetical protein
MKKITERNLTFTFSDDWEVIKYDDSHFFKNHVRKSQGCKAVDILALSDNHLFLIEIKDFRGDRLESKRSLKNDEVLNEVVQKFRDTLTGLYAAYRRQVDELAPFYRYLCTSSKYSTRTRYQRKIVAVFFMEPDTTQSDAEFLLRGLEMKMKNQLKFLNVNCLVHNRKTYAKKPLGWSVTG